MKIVSSPEMVPTTSGQRAVSIATATLCAAPMVVRSTVKPQEKSKPEKSKS